MVHNSRPRISPNGSSFYMGKISLVEKFTSFDLIPTQKKHWCVQK